MTVSGQQVETIEPRNFSIKSHRDLLLRSVEVRDEHDISALYRNSRHDLLGLSLPTPVLDAILSQQQLSQERGIAQAYPNAKTLVVEHRRGVIARLIFERSRSVLRLIDIIVSPLYQRQGLARHLICYLQEIACRYMVPLTLRSTKTNHAARQLYFGCDFKVDSEDEISEQMVWFQTDRAAE